MACPGSHGMDEIAKLVHSFFLAMILDTKNRWAGLAWICSHGMDKTANAVLSFLVDSKITQSKFEYVSK